MAASAETSGARQAVFGLSSSWQMTTMLELAARASPVTSLAPPAVSAPAVLEPMTIETVELPPVFAFDTPRLTTAVIWRTRVRGVLEVVGSREGSSPVLSRPGQTVVRRSSNAAASRPWGVVSRPRS